MKSLGVGLSVLVFVVVAGCSEGQHAPKQAAVAPAPSADATTTTPSAEAPASASPKVRKTYVPADGDPQTHEFNLTIRDEPPLDAYDAASASRCQAIVWGPQSEQLGELVVSAPNEKYELAMLKTFGIPATAVLMPNGTCQASMTITLPYAPRYVLGLGIMGRGIAPENAPLQPVVVTEGDSQDAVVVE